METNPHNSIEIHPSARRDEVRPTVDRELRSGLLPCPVRSGGAGTNTSVTCAVSASPASGRSSCRADASRPKPCRKHRTVSTGPLPHAAPRPRVVPLPRAWPPHVGPLPSCAWPLRPHAVLLRPRAWLPLRAWPRPSHACPICPMNSKESHLPPHQPRWPPSRPILPPSLSWPAPQGGHCRRP